MKIRPILQIIALLVLCCAAQVTRAEFPILPTNSPPPSWNPPPGLLDSWSFQDTTNWTSDAGYFPVAFSNICLSPLGPGNSLQVDSQTNSTLEFNVWESSGATNLNLEGSGSVMFWFAPNWASTSDTNDDGTGPGVGGRLLEVGTYTTNASSGWWSLYMDSGGNNLYFAAQDAFGDQTNYLSTPITWTSNEWHLLALTWSETNTALYVDGTCVTNGAGISILPSMEVASNGFSIGSDMATGTMQMHGAMNSLQSYNYPLAQSDVSGAWVLTGIFYYRDPDAMDNFTNAPYEPEISQIYDVMGGPGYLVAGGENTTTCFTNENVWITNVTSAPGTNNSVNMSFMVTGGSPDLPYDVFATTYLTLPLTNGVWTWLGQAYPCQTNTIYGLTNRAVYLLLGTPLSYDGDGFTVAFDNLILHINPTNPAVAGDGIANGFKFLSGIPLTTVVKTPTLTGVTVPCCPTE